MPQLPDNPHIHAKENGGSNHSAIVVSDLSGTSYTAEGVQVLWGDVLEKPFQAYEGSEPYIFVCYAHADAEFVYPEIERLRDAGFNIWYDEGIDPGAEWSDTLAEQIKGCKAFVYYITPRGATSEHCRREVNFALEQTCAILAIHFEPTELPDGLKLTLSNRQAILRYENPRDIYDSKVNHAIRRALAGHFEYTGDPVSLQIGDWVLDMGTQRLRREHQEESLDPKEIAVMLHLAERAPDLVTTQGLLARSWPGVVVGDNVVHKIVANLRKALGDDARSPRYIETLPKRGYRLLVPVAVAKTNEDLITDPVGPSGAVVNSAVKPQRLSGESIRSRSSILIAASLVLLCAVAYATYESLLSNASPDLPRLAVAPFSNISDPSDVSLATAISQSTVGHLANTGLDVTRAESDDEGGNYVLTGNIQETANTIRVNVHLADQEGNTRWTQAYEAARHEDPVIIQERTARQVAFSVTWELTKMVADQARLKQPSDRSAIDYLALAGVEQGGTFAAERFATSAEYLERAIELDGDLLPALALRADGLLSEVIFGYAKSVDDNIRYAKKLTAKALWLDDRNEFANVTHARALWISGNHEQAILQLQRFALLYDSAQVRTLLGLVQVSTLRVDEASRNLAKAVSMGVQPAGTALLSGVISLTRQEYDKANDEMKLILEVWPYPEAYVFAITALVKSGRAEEAAEAFRRYRAQFPQVPTKSTLDLFRVVYPSHIEMLTKSLKAAGWDGVS